MQTVVCTATPLTKSELIHGSVSDEEVEEVQLARHIIKKHSEKA